MRMMRSATTKTVFSSAGGLTAAVGSTLCCAGPLVAVLLGVSGAGPARTFDVRPARRTSSGARSEVPWLPTPRRRDSTSLG